MSDSHGTLIVGATAGVGRALAERFAEDGHNLVLTGRSNSDLAPLVADLHLRYGVDVHGVVFDVTDTGALEGFLDALDAHFSVIDAALLPAGVSVQDDTDDGVSNPELSRMLIDTNFTGVVAVAGAMVERFEQHDAGTLVLFSSIAVAAPRKRNVVYAAAKAALESYAASLRHRLAGSGISVQVYILGYVDTNLSRGQKLALPPAAPSEIAGVVAENLDGGSFVVHSPRFWRLVTAVLKRLPWAVYRRLNF